MMRTSIAVPPCTEIVPSNQMIVTDENRLIILLFILAVGIISNGILVLLQCGRVKLSTTCFTYIRILAIFQLAFFLVPFPLKLISDNYQRGQSWISVNFLPVLLGDWHFAISSVIICFACRIQVIVSYVRRSRRWNAHGWIAWRKAFWIMPFGTIINVSLCFEYKLDIQFCTMGNTTHAVGTAKLSEAAKDDLLKLNSIRAVPTVLFWLTFLITLLFVLQERCVLPKLSSPFSAKHLPLMRNLKPLLLAMVLCEAVIHVPATYELVTKRKTLDEETSLLLYSSSYAASPIMMMLLSKSLRNHFWLILRLIARRKEEDDMNPQGGSGKRRSSTLLKHSKLEVENSEIDDRYHTITHGLRVMVTEDMYRMRFAVPSVVPGVPVIEEEEEPDRRIEHHPPMSSAVSHASDQLL